MSAFRVLPNWRGCGRYEGQVDEQDRPHGKGILRYAESVDKNTVLVYEGEFHHGLRHGRGFMLYNKGDSFEGTWRNGRQHFGTYSWRKYPGDRYVGGSNGASFEDEDALMIYGDKGYDRGSFKSGKMEGWGTMVRKDGYSRCNFVAGLRQGRIATFWWNGCVLEATYVNDHRVGPATFFWPNGDIWIGNIHTDTGKETLGTGIRTEEATGLRTPGEFRWVFTFDHRWDVSFLPGEATIAAKDTCA